MRQLNRIRSASRYLRQADVVTRWRVHRSICPGCNAGTFVSLGSTAFLTRCLGCFANVTNLSLIPVIQQHQRACAVDVAWEMSTYGATLQFLRRTIPCVYQSEYFPGQESGVLVNGILNQDVQNLAFDDATLDLITSSQVFEHVEDDIQGFRECFRVLRAGGALVFSVPLHDIPATQQLVARRDGMMTFLAPPEFHDSRRDGPGSALCYWRHSYHDIVARVASVGFTAQMVEVRLPETLPESTFVIYAVKPA